MIRPPCLNFAIYTVHMRSYMLPSRSMGSWQNVVVASKSGPVETVPTVPVATALNLSSVEELSRFVQLGLILA